jgi:hypothetical protein
VIALRNRLANEALRSKCGKGYDEENLCRKSAEPHDRA